MRCLYCGNELALLKKLTGYGEFCSEAHRQKYQEQYNRLALTRLLQAQEPQTERRPLQTARYGVRSRDALHAAPDRRQIEPPGPVSTRSRPPVEQPDLSGFLPHLFEPALSPTELFSTEPFLAPVTAFLPASSARPAPASPQNPMGATGGANVFSGMHAMRDPSGAPPAGPVNETGELRLLTGGNPLPVAICRIASAPIPDDSPIGYAFTTEFTGTIEALLNPLPDDAGALLWDALTARTNGAGLTHNGHGPKAEFAASSMDVTGTLAHALENSSQPGVGPPPAADDVLFEVEPQHAEDSTAVVVDLSALTGPVWTLPPAHRAEPVSVVVSDSEEIRKLLGEYFDEPSTAKEPAGEPGQTEASGAGVATPPPDAPQTAAPVQQTMAEPGGAELQPAPPDDVLSAGAQASGGAQNIERPLPIGASPAPEDSAPAPPALAEEGALLDEAQPVEPSISAPREAVPAVCDRFVPVHLDLADDAFTPIDEAEFAPPEFTIQTPKITSAPLRPKVVFGPTPASAEEDAGHQRLPIPSYQSADTPSPAQDPSRESRTGAPAQPASRLGRTLEDRSEPEPDPVIPGAAQTAARLRSVAALSKKAQRDAGESESHKAGAPDPHAAPAPAAAPPPPPTAPVEATSDLESLRLEMERFGERPVAPSVRSRRIAVAAALLLAMILIGYLLKEALAAKPETRVPQNRLETYGPSLVSGKADWSLDWAGQNTRAFPGRQIYIFRPSLSMSDYRVEFKGQIEKKALGWIFRAASPRNYYAVKLEMVKAGLSPRVILSRTAVINGEETQRSQAELPMPVNLDTVYMVRTDVWGSTFKTYIQDQLVDTWMDDRLKTGGFGLLQDQDEVAQVGLIQLYGLRLVTP